MFRKQIGTASVIHSVLVELFTTFCVRRQTQKQQHLLALRFSLIDSKNHIWNDHIFIINMQELV